MKTIHPYLRQLEEWGTALLQRYVSDLFFRTTIHITLIQAFVVVLCIAAFWALLQYTGGLILIGFIFLFSIGFGLLLAYFILRPARENLRYQKLFLSNIAHELRTPLSTIKTSTEVALLEPELSSSLKKTFSEILAELDRISQIINNLLSLNSLTRPERIQFSDVDLGPIVDGVVRQHLELANERNVKMVLKMDAHRVVWGNATALEQVVANLVKNAISYTPKSAGGVVTVSVRPDYHGMILLVVADNGIGISQEDLFHIFEPFYRADTSRVRRIKKTGSGLGLTIVNEMVRVHHGKINIQSALRKGTTVSVALPAGLPPEDYRNDRNRQDRSEVALDFSKGFSHASQ